MGVVITQAQAVTDVAGVFAALVILGAMGILLHSIVRGLERKIVHWGERRPEIDRQQDHPAGSRPPAATRKGKERKP